MAFSTHFILIAVFISFTLGQSDEPVVEPFTELLTESVCACSDEPPKAELGQKQYTCEEQKGFGKCDEDFMLGFCECTCDRCCPCNDFPPPGEARTCLQLKERNQCDEDFMEGFCECECERCSALSEDDILEVVPALTPSKNSSPEAVPKPVEGACENGLIEIFGSNPISCESVRCAQNRQKCGNRCGGLAEIKFDCKDVSDGRSAAFSSSCACAGK
eukprot:TRINITY_DN19055_c0_g1_i5.p2 TRINITY_DN19055_c0_g1~~TRINITY_DN19055_c0_g1_i5.p2  ORF type:complete len:217 (-),score=36.43 TRINITY_DN19055_c0_g1_i5:378-1028(-)